MTIRLGVAVKHLGPSQLAFQLINQGNDFVGSGATGDFVAFFEEPKRPCFHLGFSSMQIMEGWGYDAPIVATTFNTAEKLLRFPACPRKLFYVNDLEWLRRPQRNFYQLQAVYGSPQLTLIARSHDHKQVLEQLWNRPVAAVMDSFDIPQLLGLLDG